ncbi:hypothetical protein [Pseudomonas sp. KNUC1026]|uniref:hypothetical protein n=1 Tax=Pseudomonas sp. KNUC1026 TaxID=2893890 RepID=UPI001F357686|nr:hypothetical protein [Pseudomonas sp. KNUC1026]UFH50578.1 hypothetical protein LN139_05020 [Pseudomonas sp. KNUC1026]
MNDTHIESIIALLGTSQKTPDKVFGIETMTRNKAVEETPDYYYTNHKGLELLFTEKDDIFYQLNIQANPDRLSTIAYEGALPYKLSVDSSQADIHSTFGAPWRPTHLLPFQYGHLLEERSDSILPQTQG